MPPQPYISPASPLQYIVEQMLHPGKFPLAPLPLTILWTHFSTRKTPSSLPANSTDNTSPTWTERTSSHADDVDQRRTSAAMPATPVLIDASRYWTVKHHRPNVVLRIGRCRMTTFQAQGYRTQTQQGVCFGYLLSSSKTYEVNAKFLAKNRLQTRGLVGFVPKICRFPVDMVSTALLHWGHYQ